VFSQNESGFQEIINPVPAEGENNEDLKLYADELGRR
jgi:hypothetical protein